MSLIVTTNNTLPIRSSTFLFKRFRGKINIQRPRAPHYKRALVNAVTQPIIIKPKLTELCYNNLLQPKFTTVTKVDNPYQRIIAKEFVNWLNHSKFVGIFHMNSIASEDFFKAQVAFHKHNIKLKIYGKSIIRQGVTGTKYEAILPLVESKNCFLFSPEQKVGPVLKILKKIPQLILLAGITENRLMSKDQLVEFSQLPNLTMARAQLVATLNSAAGSIVQNLQTHQCHLTSLLDAHVSIGQKNDNKKPAAEEATSESPTSADKKE